MLVVVALTASLHSVRLISVRVRSLSSASIAVVSWFQSSLYLSDLIIVAILKDSHYYCFSNDVNCLEQLYYALEPHLVDGVEGG